MAKKITLLALALLLAIVATAQGRFDVAAWGGLSMGQLDGDDAGSYNHPGLAAGFESTFALGEEQGLLRALVGFGFIQKGSFIQQVDRRINLSYIEIPIMLTLNFGDGRLRLGAGVAPAVLVDAKVYDSDVYNQLQSNNFRRFDAVPLCLGVRYMVTPNLGLEARYQNSMLPITVESGSGTYRLFRTNQGIFNRNVVFSLVYRWLPR